MPQKRRTIRAYKEHFEVFFAKQRQKVRDKILWTFDLIEDLDIVPEIYLKHLEGTDGLYEIRVQQGSDIFRIFCFFDEGNLVILTHAFQKKSQKTPRAEIQRAEQLKAAYYASKKERLDNA